MSKFIVTELDTEVLEAVQTLNYRFMDAKAHDEYLPFAVSIDGCSTVVKYWGIKIWCDSDDDRNYIDCSDHMMPMLPHLIMKTKELAPIFQFNFDENEKPTCSVTHDPKFWSGFDSIEEFTKLDDTDNDEPQ